MALLSRRVLGPIKPTSIHGVMPENATPVDMSTMRSLRPRLSVVVRIHRFRALILPSRLVRGSIRTSFLREPSLRTKNHNYLPFFSRQTADARSRRRFVFGEYLKRIDGRHGEGRPASSFANQIVFPKGLSQAGGSQDPPFFSTNSLSISSPMTLTDG